MENINYKMLEKEVLKNVASIRYEYLSKHCSLSEETVIAINSAIFNYSANNHSDYKFVNDSVDSYIYEIIEKIIVSLSVKKQISVCTRITIDTNVGTQKIHIMDLFKVYKNAPLFAIIMIENNEPVLYMFKDFGIDKRLNENIVIDIMNKLGVKRYHYVVLVERNAYAEVLDYNKDDIDETRGTNTYSFKHFFTSNFGEEEYTKFKEFIDRINILIKECLGYSIVKTLTPTALFSFKKDLEKEIVGYPYDKSVVKSDGISEKQLAELMAQYIDKKYYFALLNEGDFNSRFKVEGCQFAESFITAEWLYQSISEIGKMDLTAIAMGYFKSIEQMLYVFIFAHIGENKWIDTYDRPDNWKEIPYNRRKWQSPVIDTTAAKKKKYIMMERMINFLTDYDDLFVNISVRDYLIKRLHDAQQLRNGYFHKDNLSEKEKVDKARDDAFVIYMLLFGSMSINEVSKKTLGIPEDNIQFEMLCDYMDCNCKMSYYYEDNGQKIVAIGQHDEGVMYSREGKASYTGIYMNKLLGISADKKVLTLDDIFNGPKEKVFFNKTNIPNRIYRGTFVVCDEGILISGPQELIWDNGIFYDV